MAYKGVAKMSEELAKDYIGFKLGRAGDASNNKTAKTLRRLASELEREHGDMFNNMLNAMKMSQCSDVDGTMFQNIAREMFADHKINWGRIAVLYTFAGQMAMYCDRHDMKSECANIPYWLSAFVNKNLSGWIESTGGWEALAEHFPEKKDGNDMWWGNILCTVGLVAGAAGAALVFAR